MKKDIVLHFVATTPKIYSAFDKYNLEVCKQLNHKGWNSVFVFVDSIDCTLIKEDLERNEAKVELLTSRNNKIQLFFQIARLYRKYNPKVIHVHFTIYLRIMNFIICLFSRTRLYNTIHSLINFTDAKDYVQRNGRMKLFFLRFYYWLLLLSSKKIICVSMAIKNQIVEICKCKSSKVVTNYLGVENITIKNYEAGVNKDHILFNSEKKILIANIGAFEYLKGIETLIHAIHYLKNDLHINDFKVYHIGGNRIDNDESLNYNKKIYQLAKELNISSHIVFLGKRNDVDELLLHFDIYVHPSYTEGIGAVNMEACSASLPVVATNIGGIPEIIKEKINGYLVEKEDFISLAKALTQLINNKELRRNMGMKSYEIYQRNFNIKKQVAKYIQIIGI